jgi:ribose transport system ATP-binding protein
MTMQPRLLMSNVYKHFGPTVALRGVNLELWPGEIHALVGENGAGKSTLMKILNGAVAPDAGSMQLDGVPYAPRGPQDARRRGVAMVYQELTLAQDLTVEANVNLGLEKTRFGFLRARANLSRVEEVLAVLQHPEIRPDTPVRQLNPAARQLVEIARALLVDARVLVLDEPTSSLNQEDAGRLFNIMRRLHSRGVSIVYISHFLDDIQEIADRVTVLRDGASVATGPIAQFTTPQIIQLMVGRSLIEQYPREPHAIGEPILDVQCLAGTPLPRAASMTLRRGEILGVFGMVGAGRSEFMRVLFGLDKIKNGEIVVRSIRSTRTDPRARIRQGFGFLSEDRKEDGLTLGQSLADNLTYSRLRPYTFWGFLNERARKQAVAEWLAKLGVRFSHPDQAAGDLSGGNQQKVALGRLLHQQADILLLDEPTRGIDVGSKSEIYRLIGGLAAQGKAILFVSSYLPELLGICDTLTVMVRGKLGPIRPVCEWTPEKVMADAMAG